MEVSSRLIQPFEIEGDSENPEIFFNTNLLSRKASEMSMNPKVSLTYVNGKRMSYVCWQGDATRVSSPDHKKHWREWLRVFYPEGPDGEIQHMESPSREGANSFDYRKLNKF